MVIDATMSIMNAWKANFDRYTIEAEKNIAIVLAENAKHCGVDRLNSSTCPIGLSWYYTEFLFLFWEQVNQWVEAQGLARKTCNTILKPANRLCFEEVVNRWYARIAEKHQINFIKHLIDCERARLQSEDGMNEEY